MRWIASGEVMLEKIYTDNYYENKTAQTVFCIESNIVWGLPLWKI